MPQPDALRAQHRLRGNRWIGNGLLLAVSLTAAIVTTPWGQTVFDTAPPPAGVFALLLLPCALGMLALEEASKARVRRTRSTTGRGSAA